MLATRPSISGAFVETDAAAPETGALRAVILHPRRVARYTELESENSGAFVETDAAAPGDRRTPGGEYPRVNIFDMVVESFPTNDRTKGNQSRPGGPETGQCQFAARRAGRLSAHPVG
jgi:hypothetical protein